MNTIQIAADTLKTLAEKKYINKFGEIIELADSIEFSVKSSVLYEPGIIAFEEEPWQNDIPVITVVNDTTLNAAVNLQENESEVSVCILSFASGTSPGGGFKEGCLAQEESIARASSLYSTLLEHPKFYQENKKTKGIGTDHIIYSPNITVFRKEDGDWYDVPYTVSVVTSPAPDIKHYKIENINITEILENRINQILNVMIAQDHRVIVLGAWGCGVFGNDPEIIAELFKKSLKSHPFFDRIVFAVHGPEDSANFKAFQSRFV